MTEAEPLVTGGLYCGNTDKKPCSMCHIAIADVSVVFAVFPESRELKVPLRKV
jgi:hypothetical protein